jgi:hypothetical protein
MKRNNYNILGVYEDEDQVTAAVDVLLDNQVKIETVFSPYPLHHLWDKLGLKTRIPYLTFLYGALGTLTIFAFLYWTSVVSYPLKFGGKPLNTLSFIIIMFVLTILSGTVLTFLTFFYREKQYPGKKVELPYPDSVDDKFVVVIPKPEADNAAEFDRIQKLLKETGAVEITESDVHFNND